MQQQPYLSYSSIAVNVKSCIPDMCKYHTAVCQQYRYYTSYSEVSYPPGEPDEGDRDAVHEPDPGLATSPAGGEVLEERCHGDGEAEQRCRVRLRKPADLERSLTGNVYASAGPLAGFLLRLFFINIGAARAFGLESRGWGGSTGMF